MVWIKDHDCALCNARLENVFKFYFGKHFVAVCEPCYHSIDKEIEASRSECIRSIFRQARRSFALQDREEKPLEELATEIMDKFEPVFKKLSNS